MKKVFSTMLFTTISFSSLLAVNLHTCTECHGKHFEKSAMALSRIVKDLTKEELEEALEGYKKDNGQTIEVNLGICVSCHGEGFEKPAMGVSRVVAEMSKADLKASLHGYKDGTYGRDKQALMLNQIINFSEEELDAIAEKIFMEYHYE